jgi:hypothetical protein
LLKNIFSWNQRIGCFKKRLTQKRDDFWGQYCFKLWKWRLPFGLQRTIQKKTITMC